MSNNPFDGISTAILSSILARAVMTQAVMECPEIVESRSNNEHRFLAFVVATAKNVDDAIDRLNKEADRLGHVDTDENLEEFRVAIDKEVKVMADAGLAAFRAFPAISAMLLPVSTSIERLNRQ